jgi:hypothetical protein
MADFVECVRWFRLKPTFTVSGDLKGVDVDTVLKNCPRTADPVIQVTFRVPKAIFEPKRVLLQLDENLIEDSPLIMVGELKKMVEELEA